MLKQKNLILFLVVALIGLMMLVACGGTGEVEQAVEEAADQVKEEAAAAVEEKKEEVVEEVKEVVEEKVEEVKEVVEEKVEEITEGGAEEPEEVVEEVAEMEPCGPVADGALAGVDPRGQEVLWWHNHTGSREERG